MLAGKTIILGVTGSIAAYKIANLASMLMKQHCEVHVIMTENATKFINPITFESLTNQKCLVETFDRNFQFHVAHVSLAKKADAMLIAPASANVIAKLANGIADDMLTTTALAMRGPMLVAPAMNTAMYENPITQDNIKKLQQYGKIIIEPDTGYLACKDVGKGKMVSETVLMEYLLKEVAREKDLQGKRVLITAGPTREAIDPVRYITNHSTGKMGYALARCAMLRGAKVTLITGPTNLEKPMFVDCIEVTTAKEMFEAVKEHYSEADYIIKSAAVADYRPSQVAQDKIKKQEGEASISLERTDDILAYLGAHKKPGQIICGFSMETKDLIENSKAKLKKKNVDMIVANNVKVEGAGFGTDTNVVTLITEQEIKNLPLLSKQEVADEILTKIQTL
ncbi:MAG: bifunctional phosphopantothenoylcysteine decarboxylase/phosphopantothenate--cysteine ligase CoaBC [Lachnospiraceae bacterium]|nr:bifunctional phosphopantothenoylcysteine decarboxylase/phosphopantothenate--cysteine ligase CoaBC [Lachnospiraceae bacterium]MEE1341315.1 bifunctional phosphopantothenoylcysteine decarboxylase/phosphopantothenate--cysteine ligase CoaBC [Lachnospiraceae bacterium]